MVLDDLTALARLRLYGASILPKLNVEAAIATLVRDKDYVPMIENISMGTLDELVFTLLLRGGEGLNKNNAHPRLLRRKLVADPKTKTYYGAPAQNVQIDRTLAMMKHLNFVGDGAAGNLSEIRLGSYLADSYLVSETPIAIIGNGAAGIILHATLVATGFRRVTVYDRRVNALGIWGEKSVYEGSRNNPRSLTMLRQTLHAAPGAGEHVVAVLRQIRSTTSYSLNAQVRQNMSVKQIIPGDLDHAVVTDETLPPARYPIVINASGMGLPKPLTDPTRMIGPEHHVRAIRWQYPQLAHETKKQKKRRYVFVGLGNSTAEMLHVVQALKCDYRVLTHYPRDAVNNPSQTVHSRGSSYRVFRDLSVPNLTSYQGDLVHSRQAYYRALIDGKIIPDVAQWDATNGDNRKLSVRCQGEKKLHETFEFDDLYVLTGYRHTASSFDSMGISYDQNLTPFYDYDGEFHTDPHREYRGDESKARLYKGYFGFGGVLNAPHNRNSVVIPGMIFRAPDLLFGIIMRAIEYQRRSGRLNNKV